jgi:hypothetical protein
MLAKDLTAPEMRYFIPTLGLIAGHRPDMTLKWSAAVGVAILSTRPAAAKRV